MMTDVAASQEDIHEMVKELPDDQAREVLAKLREDQDAKVDESVDMGDDHDDGEYPQSQEQVIKQISLSMEWLRDLRDTVVRRGVSSADMQALREIRGSLESVGVAFDPTPALEHYPIASYTDERSSVNLEVGVESISRTIIQTIKNWLRKLVEYAKKLYQWVKQHIKSEQRFEKAFSTYPEAIAIARDGRVRVEKTRTTRISKELEQRIDKKRTRLLTDSDLKRNPLQLAALNVPTYADKVTHLEQDTLAFTRMVEAQVDQVEAALSNRPQSVRTVDDSPSVVGKMLLDEIAVLDAEMPQRDYLKRQVNPAYFDEPLRSVTWKVSPYDYLTTMHEELVKQLSGIRQISDEVEHVDQLSEILSDVSQNIDQLVQLSQFFYRFNHLKRETLKRLYMLENELFSMVYRDAVKDAPDTRHRESLDKIRGDVQQSITKILK